MFMYVFLYDLHRAIIKAVMVKTMFLEKYESNVEISSKAAIVFVKNSANLVTKYSPAKLLRSFPPSRPFL